MNFDAYRPVSRSVFWPVLLIGVGVVWLLSALGVTDLPSGLALLRGWPILLVAIGLDLIFGHRSTALSAMIAVAAILACVGLSTPNAASRSATGVLRDEHFSAPLEGTRRAQVHLDLGSAHARVHALSGGTQLLEAQIHDDRRIKFQDRGGETRRLSLSHARNLGPVQFDFFSDQGENRWDVGLSRAVPLELTLDSGSGSVTLDLEAVQLDRLRVDSGSGSVDARLPGNRAYRVELDGGSGQARLRTAAGAELDFRGDLGSGGLRLDLGQGSRGRIEVDMGSGMTEINTSGNPALRLELEDGGSGRLDLPAGLERVSGDPDEKEGAWETPGFAQARERLTVVIDLGSGGLRIR
ncbi:hypothetical protein HNR42_003363 [Deinobacterium chartae]|uniref:LiaF transmembrane domain-containing protein n=1 Tax=Deinobacterium chartae TaxID=521158 RepID=A0A841I3L7_9DEIO|nr:hypothetical protein [Deinobacterium chartae]